MNAGPLTENESAVRRLEDCRRAVDGWRQRLQGLLEVGTVAPHKQKSYEAATSEATRQYQKAAQAHLQAAVELEALMHPDTRLHCILGAGSPGPVHCEPQRRSAQL